MANKKMLMIAPNFYGIDKSISMIFGTLGFEVTLKNARNKLETIESLALRIAKKVPFTEKALTPILKHYLDLDNKEYLSIVSRLKPDVLFVIKGETIYPETLDIIKNRMKIPCVAYEWDCPFFSYSGHFIDTYRRNNFAKGMYLYDHIFSHDPYYVREMEARGISHVSYLPLATDPNQFRDMEVTLEEKSTYGFDVCFVGSPLPNRMEILDNLKEFNLGVFGDGWDMWHRLRMKKIPDYYKGKATGEKVLKLYKSSKIVLNIHGPEAKEGANTRTFDIPACGAFELTDYKPEMDNLFKAGEEIAYYKDINELKRLVRYYLENPEKRLSITEKGRNKVLNSHTWHHRMQEVAEHIRTKLF